MVLGFWSWENLYTAKQHPQKIGRKQYQIYFGPWPTVANKESSLKKNNQLLFSDCQRPFDVENKFQLCFDLVCLVKNNLVTHIIPMYYLCHWFCVFVEKILLIYFLMHFFCTSFALYLWTGWVLLLDSFTWDLASLIYMWNIIQICYILRIPELSQGLYIHAFF